KRAFMYRKQQAFTAALADMNAAIKISPLESRYYACRSDLHEKLGQTLETVSDLSKAIELHPTFVFYGQRAAAYSLMGEFAKSLADADMSGAMNPSSALAHVTRATSLQDCSKKKEAIEECNKAIALDPTSGLAYFVRSLIYKDLGEAEQAKQDAAK